MRKIYLLDPIDELRQIHCHADRLFKEVFEPFHMEGGLLKGTEEGLVTKTTKPFVDIVEKGDKFIIKADLPGVDKKDIKVDVKEGMLDITAERKDEKDEKENGYIRKERYYSKYYRSINLPTGVFPEKTEATFKDGVLELKLPKVEKIEDSKRIEVK